MSHTIQFMHSPSKRQKINCNYTILFHGNCIDGWFSAYIAYTSLKNNGFVHMYPISPSQTETWPTQITGTHILLLDVSVQEKYRDMWMKGGALSVNCIDHHASSIEHWPEGQCPINVERCAAFQTWEHFYPMMEIPSWLYNIDRIDRWDNPTYEDRCIREVLNIIAHKPVERKIDEAISFTEQFIMNMNNPIGISAIISEGKNILTKKDEELMRILSNGSIHQFTTEYIDGWKLPATWLDKRVFIIDNTSITLDTTEAAHLAFENNNISVFINYRKKFDKSSKKVKYIYSARSRGFDITEGTVLKGHPTSAGATIVKGSMPVLPFLLSPP